MAIDPVAPARRDLLGKDSGPDQTSNRLVVIRAPARFTGPLYIEAGQSVGERLCESLNSRFRDEFIDHKIWERPKAHWG